MITETWFNIKSITSVDNYSLFFKNREQIKGVGVAVYVRNDIESFEIIEKGFDNLQSEQIWCRVVIARESILIGCIYRPNDTSTEINNEINRCLSLASKLVSKKKYNGLIVAGDFNFPKIKWNSSLGIFSKKYFQKTQII